MNAQVHFVGCTGRKGEMRMRFLHCTFAPFALIYFWLLQNVLYIMNMRGKKGDVENLEKKGWTRAKAFHYLHPHQQWKKYSDLLLE